MDKGMAILILGAGIMQLPAIQIAKEKGWKLVLADGNKNALGVPLADDFLHIDLKNTEALIEAALDYKKEKLGGIFTAGTDFSTAVAAIAEKCGLPGIPLSAAEKAKDKALMRECFRSAGVPSPAFTAVTKAEDCVEAATSLQFPLVVKPSDNMGARGVKKIEDLSELQEFFHTAEEYSEGGKVIIEEFISGPEYSLDALIYGGRVDICGFADRHIRFSPYFVEMGHTMPTTLSESEQHGIIDTFKKGIQALGISEGAAKGDIKLTEQGPVVGEIAARLSGGYMSGWTYPYASGFEVTEAALEIAMGMHPRNTHPGYPLVSAERAFISIPGRVAEILGARRALQLPSVKNFFLRTSPGEDVVFPRNNIQKCGNVISQAFSRGEAIEAAEKAVRAVFIRLEAGNPRTEAFLFGPRREWPPPAFMLTNRENKAALDSMPDFAAKTTGTDRIFMLPALDSEDGKDWHGFTMKEALRAVLSGARDSSLRAGRCFWRGFLTGGVQGGIWVLDTLEKAENEGHDLKQVISKWNSTEN